MEHDPGEGSRMEMAGEGAPTSKDQSSLPDEKVKGYMCEYHLAHPESDSDESCQASKMEKNQDKKSELQPGPIAEVRGQKDPGQDEVISTISSEKAIQQVPTGDKGHGSTIQRKMKNTWSSMLKGLNNLRCAP
ncbi:hypothetical protein PCASD_17746 [Puccinia coronata f. sp. avenae]|uniref:Uncharacterized protein n=1 Tax=Puccinia coronata f. sp. avenae TaxID=200324 RepID=A0A2N5TXW7_9BASI|nr:hypothetical protein PCASD_25898 [Puccinia coronata f. sp. avenae]PLW30312.1 hypothetical protein PCASD_17746 [Puccinia coronata f. sp. avenae]